MEKIIRGSGFTASERYLNRLSDSTFLKLWTYPNTFSDRNKRGAGDGKEICDLLVVCGDDVLIFSDKEIEWPSGKPEAVAWCRWYRRAIRKSVDQIRGAERWLREFPDRVFLDAACTQKLPVDLPPPDRMRVHGLAIVRGAREACSRHFQGDDGSLVILPRLQGDGHTDVAAPDWRPFAVGDVDPAGTFVHVFDEAALDCVMLELDTVSDFTAYLCARAIAIRERDLMLCSGEADLLAYYLKMEDPRERPLFIRNLAKTDGQRQEVVLFPGAYPDFIKSGAYARKKKADARSYVWDRLIAEFIRHLMAGTSASVGDERPSASGAEPALRIMARENRLTRRILGSALTGTLEESARRPQDRYTRIAFPGPDGADAAVAYVFMTLAYFGDLQTNADYARYRQVRASMLVSYCYAVLEQNRSLKSVVAIGLDTPGRTPGSSEDLLAVAVHEWSPELELEVAERRALHNVMDTTSQTHHHATEWEFPPSPPTRQQRRASERRAAKEAKRDARANGALTSPRQS